MTNDKETVEAASKAVGGLITILQGYLGATLTARLLDEQRRILVAEGRAPTDAELRASMEAILATSDTIQGE